MATPLLWLRDLIGSANRTRRRGAKRGRKPHDRNRTRLELTWLEDRCVPAAITLIQNIGAVADDTAGATLLSIPVTHAVATGDRVTVEFYAIQANTASENFPTVTDTAGNAYALDKGFGGGNSPPGFGDFEDQGIIASAFVSSPIPVGGAITVTFDASFTARAASAQEFYGLDASASTVGSGATLDLVPTEALSVGYFVAQAPALVVASFGIGDSPANTFTLNPGATALASAGTTGATGFDATIAPGFPDRYNNGRGLDRRHPCLRDGLDIARHSLQGGPDHAVRDRRGPGGRRGAQCDREGAGRVEQRGPRLHGDRPLHQHRLRGDPAGRRHLHPGRQGREDLPGHAAGRRPPDDHRH
jgi:hypothetical protein